MFVTIGNVIDKCNRDVVQRILKGGLNFTHDECGGGEGAEDEFCA